MIMVGVDIAFGVNTPKLDIPLKFQPTNAEERGWVIPPLGKNPVWSIPAAAIPALLATILVFMDQQITALIVNRREHKLKVCLVQCGACMLLECSFSLHVSQDGTCVSAFFFCWEGYLSVEY